MKTTLKEFLGPERWAKFVNNVALYGSGFRDGDTLGARTDPGAISAAFLWVDTPEGEQYWKALSDAWCAHRDAERSPPPVDPAVAPRWGWRVSNQTTREQFLRDALEPYRAHRDSERTGETCSSVLVPPTRATSVPFWSEPFTLGFATGVLLCAALWWLA